MERLLKALSEPMVFDDIKVKIGASIGIALYPDHGHDIVNLRRAADRAMYAQKHGERSE